MPTRRPAPRASAACAWLSTRSKPSRWFSTSVIARANAAGSCRSSASRMRSTLMQSNQRRGGASRPLLRGVGRQGPKGARPHRDALHPRRRGGEDVEFQPLQREALPRPGDAAQCLEQQAAHGLRSLRLERDAQPLLESAGGGVAFELEDAGRRLARGGRRPPPPELPHPNPPPNPPPPQPPPAPPILPHPRQGTPAPPPLPH